MYFYRILEKVIRDEASLSQAFSLLVRLVIVIWYSQWGFIDSPLLSNNVEPLYNRQILPSNAFAIYENPKCARGLYP